MAFNVPPAKAPEIVEIATNLKDGNLVHIVLDCDYTLVELFLCVEVDECMFLYEIDGKEGSYLLDDLAKIDLAIRRLIRLAGKGHKNVFI